MALHPTLLSPTFSSSPKFPVSQWSVVRLGQLIRTYLTDRTLLATNYYRRIFTTQFIRKNVALLLNLDARPFPALYEIGTT